MVRGMRDREKEGERQIGERERAIDRRERER